MENKELIEFVNELEKVLRIKKKEAEEALACTDSDYCRGVEDTILTIEEELNALYAHFEEKYNPYLNPKFFLDPNEC